MWTALASAYESLPIAREPAPGEPPSNLLSAARCYKRALLGNEDVGFALVKLARLYDGFGDREAAGFYFELVRRAHQQIEGGGPSAEEFGEACTWLARRAIEAGKLEEADGLLAECGEERGLRREVRSLMIQRGIGV